MISRPCPRCGASPSGHTVTEDRDWKCGSYLAVDGFIQSDQCATTARELKASKTCPRCGSPMAWSLPDKVRFDCGTLYFPTILVAYKLSVREEPGSDWVFSETCDHVAIGVARGRRQGHLEACRELQAVQSGSGATLIEVSAGYLRRRLAKMRRKG